jgi:hypothetical protein
MRNQMLGISVIGLSLTCTTWANDLPSLGYSPRISVEDLVAKGYRWVTVNGPYACVQPGPHCPASNTGHLRSHKRARRERESRNSEGLALGNIEGSHHGGGSTEQQQEEQEQARQEGPAQAAPLANLNSAKAEAKLVKALDYLVAISDHSDNPGQKWFINESILASLTGCFEAGDKEIR